MATPIVLGGHGAWRTAWGTTSRRKCRRHSLTRRQSAANECARHDRVGAATCHGNRVRERKAGRRGGAHEISSGGQRGRLEAIGTRLVWPPALQRRQRDPRLAWLHPVARDGTAANRKHQRRALARCGGRQHRAMGSGCGRCSAYRGSPRAARPSPRGGCPQRANANQAIDEIPLCRIVGEQRHLPGARLWASRPGWHCVDGRQGTVHRRSSLSPGIAGGLAAGAVAFRTPTGGSGGRGRQVPSAPQPPPNSELVDLHGEHGDHGPKRTMAGVLARNAGRGAS